MNDGAWTTVHGGSPWELDLFCGMLDEERIPWRRPDDVVGAVDAIVDATAATSRRLQVREGDLERAQAVIASYRGDVEDTEDDEYALSGQEEVELVARSLRGASWSLVGLLLVPWLMVLYRRACREHGTRSAQHTLTAAAPWIGVAVVALLALAFRYVPNWLPDRSPGGGPPPPPPTHQPILPG